VKPKHSSKSSFKKINKFTLNQQTSNKEKPPPPAFPFLTLIFLIRHEYINRQSSSSSSSEQYNLFIHVKRSAKIIFSSVSTFNIKNVLIHKDYQELWQQQWTTLSQFPQLFQQTLQHFNLSTSPEYNQISFEQVIRHTLYIQKIINHP
jgi:hypothetical protein